MSLHRNQDYQKPRAPTPRGVPVFTHSVNHELVGRVVAIKRAIAENTGFRIEDDPEWRRSHTL